MKKNKSFVKQAEQNVINICKDLTNMMKILNYQQC